MSSEHAMLLSLLLPFAAAVIVPCLGRWPNVRESVTLIASFLLVLVVGSLYPRVMAGERPAVELVELVPGVPLAFSLEPLGMLFALVSSSLWVLTSFYSIGYVRGHNERDQSRFFACFALAMSAVMGVAFADNVVTLFVFYEVLTLSTYPLVTHSRTTAARNSGRIYLGILMGTSIGFLLLAVLWTQAAAGTTTFQPGGILAGEVEEGLVPVLLALYMFGTGKAALMPFHRWLPAAMVAPTPVSALLHAVAVVKAGVFTVLKVVVYVFGIDLLQEAHAVGWLQIVAAATILLASFVALGQDNLKARLAYSTIGQLAYIVLGASLANELGVIGGGMHIAMHAVGKITLFFCAGAVYVALHKTNVSQMRGIGRQMPFTMAAFAMASISLIGLPPFGGSWSKWFLALGAVDAGSLVLVGVLMLSSLLNLAYLLPIPFHAFFSKPEEREGEGQGGHAHHEGLHEAPALCVVPLCVTAVLCFLLFLFPDPVYDLLSRIAFHRSGGA